MLSGFGPLFFDPFLQSDGVPDLARADRPQPVHARDHPGRQSRGRQDRQTKFAVGWQAEGSEDGPCRRIAATLYRDMNGNFDNARTGRGVCK